MRYASVQLDAKRRLMEGKIVRIDKVGKGNKVNTKLKNYNDKKGELKCSPFLKAARNIF